MDDTVPLSDTPNRVTQRSVGAAGVRVELPVRNPERYERQGEIARGGMGRIVAVYDCELGRKIAIKELHSSDPAMEKRFDREVRITARLQHPAIIAVHDAGRWPSGALFYTMKHVEGRALDRVIDEKKTLDARLALLPHVLAVADALAYAHSSGVIHRDLKPANVLVGDYGETVLIDWGLAKDLRRDEAEESLPRGVPAGDVGLTVLGEAIGTPAYMPPSQARGDAVDERADVYSLGAMLYHLLAGLRPYADTKTQGVTELLEMVKRRPPTPLAKIVSDAPQDLLAIVAKAMDRNPDRRYANAGELAEDLRRFETGKLVGAHRYSGWQLAERWIRRHRAAVGVAMVMALVLVAGAALSFWRIARERNRAEAQKTVAEENREKVEDLLDFMLSDLREKLEPVGKLELLDMVARKASAYFADRPVDWAEPEEASRRAAAHDSLGDVLRERGDVTAALAEYHKSQTIRERLTASDPTNSQWQHGLAVSHERVGGALTDRGDLGAALVEYRKSLAVRERLAAADPADANSRRRLAVTHDWVGDVVRTQGDLPSALSHFRQALTIREKLARDAPAGSELQRVLGISHVKVGDVLYQQGDLSAALESFRASLEIDERLATLDPTNAVRQRSLSASHDRVGEVLCDLGDHAAGLVEYRKSLAISKRLAARDPSNTRWQRDVAISHNDVGNALGDLGKFDAALAEFRESLAIRKRLAARDPANAGWQRDMSVGYEKVGNVLLDLGDLAGSLAAFSECLAISERLTAIDPSNVVWQRDLGVCHERIGVVQRTRGDRAAAVASFRNGVAVFERLAQDDPSSSIWQRFLAGALTGLGAALEEAGNREEARAPLDRAAAIYERTARIAVDFYTAACAHALAGNADEAFAMLDKAVERGWRNPAQTAEDTDLAALRNDARWKPLLESMQGPP